jgi:hypothetical protein
VHAGDVSTPYRFEAKGLEDKVLGNALDYMAKLEASKAPYLNPGTAEQIFKEIPGLLPELRQGG